MKERGTYISFIEQPRTKDSFANQEVVSSITSLDGEDPA